ncbi:hypothetical protein niasHT_036405 [Heterodera trifolii]|uniref:Uncharacterized protein n=1 Tax=Heterodera trifolii TaxID=157864 RepID=A0ABD2I0C2_9BILA
MELEKMIASATNEKPEVKNRRPRNAPTTQPSHPLLSVVPPPPPPPIDSDVAELLHEIQRRGKRLRTALDDVQESIGLMATGVNELATSTSDGLVIAITLLESEVDRQAVKLRSLRRALHPPPDVETLSVISLEKGTAVAGPSSSAGSVGKPTKKVEKKRRNEDEK